MARRGPPKNAVRLEMTEARKQTFLSALRASGGVFSAACRAASPHSTADPDKHPPCYSSFKALIARDAEFSVAVQEVMDQCRDDVEAEMFRRGQIGWEEPVFQKGGRVIDHDGSPASIRRFSDNLLLARARALMPDRYGDRKTVEHRGTVHVQGGGHWVINATDLAALSPGQRENLSEIMATVRVARQGGDAAIRHRPAEVIEAEFEETEAVAVPRIVKRECKE